MSEFKLTRDHHLLTRNLQLNSKYISNDGGDEGITINNLGKVTTSGVLDLGTINEVGSDTDKILMSDSGEIKFVTGSNLRSYIGAGTSSVADLDDLSDVTYSSGDLTISSLDTITYANSNNAVLSVAETSSGTDGRNLTIQAGSAPAGYANQNGGALILAAGGGDGTGTSYMSFLTKVNGTDAVAERMKIDTSGYLLVNDKIIFTQTDGNEFIDSQADGYLDLGATTAIRLEAPTLCEDKLYFTQTDGNEFIDSHHDGYLDIGATTALRLKAPTLCEDKLYFTQTDGNEYIDSLNDGYLDIDATTAIRLKADVEASGDIKVTDTVYFAAETINACDSSGTAASATIDWNASQKQILTITGTNNTINFTNPAGPCNLLLKIVQGDGEDTITAGHYHANVKWAGGAKPTLSTGDGAIDIVSFYFDGTSYHGVGSIGFATV